jgi:hypothetical protein
MEIFCFVISNRADFIQEILPKADFIANFKKDHIGSALSSSSGSSCEQIRKYDIPRVAKFTEGNGLRIQRDYLYG